MIRKQSGLLGWNGVLARLLITAVMIGVLATARPSEPWAWPVLVAALLSFLAGTFLMHHHELWSLGLLSYAALSAAVITGMPGSNALILVLVPVTDVAVMTFVRTPRLRRNQPIIALGIGCALAYGVSTALYDRTSSWLLSQLLWTAVLILFGLNRRHDELRVQQTAKLLDQTVLAQREHSRAAALDERTRIARELHDVLAHSLGALSVQLELAEALLSEKDDREAALDRIRRSRRLAVQGLTEARNAVATLRQDQVPALPEALESLTAHHGQDHGGIPSFTVTGEVRAVDPGVVVALLGAARESLTNAARHAPGRPAEVDLIYSPTAVRLEIRNRLGPPAMRPEGPRGPRPLRPEKERSEPTAGSSAAKPAGAGGQASPPLSPAEDRGTAAGAGYGLVGMRERLASEPTAGSSAAKPAGAGGQASPPLSPAEDRDTAAGAGFGLAGMRERLALVGGELSAGVVDGEWVVVAEVEDE
ncbi:histidine kinase [Kribbella sp. DT2]|uniref:sensor histidine kinase n=1 Tax=Kribbella sp. DT2 TaxID=3393427 RepID=UPI003CFB92CD